MKTRWDYTDLAEAYLKRPEYAPEALEALFSAMALPADALVCDVGAGVAHLTLELARRGFRVQAVEPNDAMRERGQLRTREFETVQWSEGTGEATGQLDHRFDLVSFGSSFNVCDRHLALQETARILKPQGWFACMWNHRELEDPIQQRIEAIIQEQVPDYRYGTRREDQRPMLEQSGLFAQVHDAEGRILHRQSMVDVVTAWRSHATLHRQAGAAFDTIIADIETYLEGLQQESIEVPYQTRIWFAQLKPISNQED